MWVINLVEGRRSRDVLALHQEGRGTKQFKSVVLRHDHDWLMEDELFIPRSEGQQSVLSSLPSRVLSPPACPGAAA